MVVGATRATGDGDEEAVEFGHERRTLGACAGNAEVLKGFCRILEMRRQYGFRDTINL